MEKVSVNKRDVEAKLAGVGDYVKMDYLQQCLNKQMDFDTKRFVMTKLSSIYESKLMFLEAAKLLKCVADINTTFEGKYLDFAKSMELYIKGGNFDEADLSFKKAMVCANDKQKVALKSKMKEIYKTRAKELMDRDKRKNAMEVYEKLISVSFLDSVERKEIQNSLLQLYQRLGKIKEFDNLQRNINNPSAVPPKSAEEKPRYDDFNIDDLLN